MRAGVRKIPEPIVEPMRTAVALKRPSWRGSFEGASAGDGMRDIMALGPRGGARRRLTTLRHRVNFHALAASPSPHFGAP